MADDSENKMTGQVTLLIYRIAIGPVILMLLGWIWNLQKEVSKLMEENKALFATSARLEAFARRTSTQASYLEGLKDTILSGATGPREFAIRVEMPQDQLQEQIARIEAQHEKDLSFFQNAAAKVRAMLNDEEETPPQALNGPDSVEEIRPEQGPASQMQIQEPSVDYDRLPELSEEELRRYRQTMTKGAK